MLIFNNVSQNEWRLILSALRNELRDDVMNQYFPKRQDEIRKLIKKIEGFTGDNDFWSQINKNQNVNVW
jgi:hypothetical protein